MNLYLSLKILIIAYFRSIFRPSGSGRPRDPLDPTPTVRRMASETGGVTRGPPGSPRGAGRAEGTGLSPLSLPLTGRIPHPGSSLGTFVVPGWGGVSIVLVHEQSTS